MKTKQVYFLLVIGLMLITGCMVGKKYKEPTAPQNISYRLPPAVDTTPLVKWFELYGDTVLQNMIKVTLDSNRDLLTVASRIEESRLQAAIVKANLYPRFDYQATAGGGKAGTEAQKIAGGIQGGYLSAFGVLNWELDVWGKIRHAKQSAIAQYLSVVQNRNALQVSLISEVASQYFLLRDLDNRLAIAQSTLVGRQENTRIISDRFDHGYVAELDKLQAIQQEKTAASTIPALQREIVAVENSLRLLMGLGPGPVNRGYSNFEQTLAPEIPVGLPSQLLERRPDIMAAEQSMKSQFELIGVAQANRFPSITLTGVLGFASPQLGTFLSSNGLVANGFGAITGPIFNFGQRKNQVLIERQRFNQDYLQYQQTVLAAFGDVDNALTSLRTYSEEYEQIKEQVDAADKALKLSMARYHEGYTAYLEVIIMEDNLFVAQLAESQALAGKLNAIVLLYKSLGGGW